MRGAVRTLRAQQPSQAVSPFVMEDDEPLARAIEPAEGLER